MMTDDAKRNSMMVGTKRDSTKDGSKLRYCEACGAVVYMSSDATTLWSDVSFCERCLRTLHAAEIARMSCEVALRGVPWS